MIHREFVAYLEALLHSWKKKKQETLRILLSFIERVTGFISQTYKYDE